jgi:hypothetical protein
VKADTESPWYAAKADKYSCEVANGLQDHRYSQILLNEYLHMRQWRFNFHLLKGMCSKAGKLGRKSMPWKRAGGSATVASPEE